MEEEKKSKKRTKTLVKIGLGMVTLIGCEYLFLRGEGKGFKDIPQANVDIFKKMVKGVTTLTPKEETSSIDEVEQVVEAPVKEHKKYYYNNKN